MADAATVNPKDAAGAVLEGLGGHARRLAFCRAMEAACLVAAVAASAVALWLVIAVLLFPAGRSGWSLLAIPLAGALAGVIRLLMGVRPARAARWLDGRYRLADGLSTAEELARKDAHTPASQSVFGVALRTLETLPARCNYGRRTRRTPAALLLGLLLCGSAWLVPEPAGEPLPDRSQRVGQAGPGPSGVLPRIVSDRSDSPETLPTELAALREALRRGDRDEVQRLMHQLRERGYRFAEVDPARSGRTVGPPDQSPRSGNAPNATRQTERPASRRVQPRDGGVAVSDPRYRGQPEDAPSTDQAPENPPDAGPARWSAVRAEAVSADRRTPSPARFRPLLRAFRGSGAEGK